jgi:hypothetical protein
MVIDVESNDVPTQELPRMKMLKKLKKLVRRPVKIEHADRDPEMQMNQYNVNELLSIIQSLGIRNLYMEFTDHGGGLGVFFYFQKP